MGHSGAVYAVACHGVGEGSGVWRVVSGSFDKTVRVWDGAAGGAALLTLEGHSESVNAVACHGVAGGGWRGVARGERL